MQEKEDSEPRAHILERGEYDKPQDEVGIGVPEFLPGLAENAPPNRLGLAQWLTAPDHPLTARVTVNRMWQEIFGAGLVKTSEDFGTQGESPSHSELLDWLAVTFVESGWNMKALYKKMLMSSTYRQSSRVTPEMQERDPENRLLARGSRYRLDAEVLRDLALPHQRFAEPESGRSRRSPLATGGNLAGGGLYQFEHPDLLSRSRERRTSANGLHFLETNGAAAESRDLRCAESRGLRGAPGTEPTRRCRRWC